MSNWDDVKKNVGEKAATLVEDGMHIGLGTGSTAKWVIESLSKRVKEGLKIKAIATSKESERLALAGGIELLDPCVVTELDLCIDGADELAPDMSMIKGRGGALWREKIVATMAREMIVIIDETKLVKKLGEKAKLPVEVSFFGKEATLKEIEALGFKGAFRKEGVALYKTDAANAIIDLDTLLSEDLRDQHKKLIGVPGVIETGLFFDLAKRAVVGYRDGRVEVV